MGYFLFYFAVALLFFFQPGTEGSSLWSTSGPHRLYIGPEFYHAKRTKDSGSKQTGWLWGGRGLYERRRHAGFYWAADAYYACGEISGKTASGSSLLSKLRDSEIEGRLGYAFCVKKDAKLTMIPYGGYGYFYSKNAFKKPSPLPYDLDICFEYGLLGAEASFFPFPCLECGLNFKAKYMLEGKSKVKDDPDFDNFTQEIESQIQYEADLPFRYYSCLCNKQFIAVFAPFYRYRHFGGKVNWPFDFIDTKYSIYGARLLISIFF